jgi:serine/threonine-protein kinase
MGRSSRESEADRDLPRDEKSGSAEDADAGRSPLPLDPNDDELTGSFGRYRIISKLGEGGMGTVYLVEDTKLHRRIALKTPFFEFENEPLAIKRFLREARSAATIHHPNVCPVYDVGQHAGRYFLTMAHVDGCSLAEWMQLSPQVSVATAVEIVEKLARGLQAAHDAGVLHRDLKPGNILIDRNNEPYLIDFGMARRLDRDESLLTVTGVVVGTPAYMAPEQISGRDEQIGPATDIYSLGAIFYELLAGSIPFTGNLATMLGSIVSNHPIPLCSFRADVDPHVERLCRRAMAKSPADRYPSARVFAEALRDYLDNLVDTEKTGPQGEPTAAVIQGRPKADMKPSRSRSFRRMWRQIMERL